MNAEELAKEFRDDIIEDINQKFSEVSYGFNENVLSDDPELKIIKSEFLKLGFILTETSNNLYNIQFSKDKLLENMCQYVDNHIFQAKDDLLKFCKTKSATQEVISAIDESYNSCRNQIIDNIKNLV